MMRLLVGKYSWVAAVVIFWCQQLHASTYNATNATGAASKDVTTLETLYLNNFVVAAGESAQGLITYHGLSFVSNTLVLGPGIFNVTSSLSWSTNPSALALDDTGAVEMLLWPTTTVTADAANRAIIEVYYNQATIKLLGDLEIAASITFRLARALAATGISNLTLDGNGNRLTLSDTMKIQLFDTGYATTCGSLTLKNMDLVVKTSTPFSFTSTKTNLTLDSVNLFLQNNGTAVDLCGSTASGSLTIKNNVNVYGPGETLLYRETGTGQPSGTTAAILLSDNSELAINDGVTLKLASDLAAKNTKLYMATANSVLRLNNATLHVPVAGLTYPGLQLERGTVVCQHSVVIQNEGNQEASKGLILGDGATLAKDVSARICGGARLLVDGFLYHRPA